MAGTKTKVLETSTFLTLINYYDDRYRMIQNCRSLYDGASGGLETLANLYDFSGKIKQSKQLQTFNLNNS